MRRPLCVDGPDPARVDPRELFSGRAPGLVVRGFYDEARCRELAGRIAARLRCLGGAPSHVGPSLAAHATDREGYFGAARDARGEFAGIFRGVGDPMPRMRAAVGRMFRGRVRVASERGRAYSPGSIRIHRGGDSVPVHRDHAGYEGREYAVSGIDHQLSCVLRVQEPEGGGDLIVYGRRWEVGDERFRNVDFGYSPRVTGKAAGCRISGAGSGDLVIINPAYYHRVTTVAGGTPRITLGMFLGFRAGDPRIVAWS